MKSFRFLLLALFLMAFQCEEDILIQEDDLSATGILGKWEIANESVNGISDMSVKCCRFIEFRDDENEKDLRGSLAYTEFDMIYEGTFTVDPPAQQIVFEQDDFETVVYNYTISSSGDYLTFTYRDGDSDIEEGWVKIEEP